MKKALKVTMGVALAASALTPAAALAAENTTQAVALDGYYNTVTGQFYSPADFKALDKAAKKAIVQNNDFILVVNGKVYPGNAIAVNTNAELATNFTPQADYEAENEITFTDDGRILDKDGEVIDTVLAVSDVVATTDETTRETTVTATAKNYEAGAKATVTVTPDASLELEDIVTKDVAIAADGKISLNLGELPNGTHKVKVTVGTASESAEFVVDLDAAPVAPSVESVSAINQTIASGVATDLKFTVNGEEELTKAEFEEKYEGYTASFLFNTDALSGSKTSGKVSATADFKYAVQVTDAEGNKLPETVAPANFADVKVADATKAVEVTEFGLVDWDLDYITTDDKAVEIKATKALNTFGNEVTENQLPKVEKVTSSDPTVAYYDGTIQPRKEGKVTFTVKFAGIDATSTIDVEVKAAQKATSIQADNQKIQAGTLTANQIEAYFNVLDQYGEELRIEDNTTIKVLDQDSKVVAPGEQGYNLTKAGIYTVEVNAGDVKLGSFTIETVEVDASKVDEYKIVAGKGFGLDLNPDLKDEDGAAVDKTKATLNIEGFVKGVKLENDQFDLTGFEVKSSNEDAVQVVLYGKAIKLTAEKTGNSTISLIKVEGDLRTTVATYEVEVANTTELVDSLTLKEDTKVEVKMSQDGKTVVSTDEELAAAVTTATVEGEKDENLADKIASVEVVQNNKVVIVKLTETYGGKEFVLDAKFVTDASEIAPIEPTPVFDFTATDSTATAGTSEFTFDVEVIVGTEAAEGTPEVLVTVVDSEGENIAVSNTLSTEYVEGTSTVTVTTAELAEGTYTVTVTIDGVEKTIDLVVTA